MKTITATKVSDGSLVNIKETQHLHCESDVLKFIKQNGLNVKKQFSVKGKSKYTHIFAD